MHAVRQSHYHHRKIKYWLTKRRMTNLLRSTTRIRPMAIWNLTSTASIFLELSPDVALLKATTWATQNKASLTDAYEEKLKMFSFPLQYCSYMKTSLLLTYLEAKNLLVCDGHNFWIQSSRRGIYYGQIFHPENNICNVNCCFILLPYNRDEGRLNAQYRRDYKPHFLHRKTTAKR